MRWGLNNNSIVLSIAVSLLLLIGGGLYYKNDLSLISSTMLLLIGGKLDSFMSPQIVVRDNEVRINMNHLRKKMADPHANSSEVEHDMETTTNMIHHRLANQHKKLNLHFSSRHKIPEQSICVISMHEYSKGEMKLLNQNLTDHKRDFTHLHTNMGYIDINPSPYRQRYKSLESTWLKLPAMRDIMAHDDKHNFDWYMWVDADVVFTNHSCTFQELLPADQHVVYAGDFNSGVFLIRNHPWSLRFLDAWFSLRTKFEHSFGAEDDALGDLLTDDQWSPYIYWTPMDRFSLIGSYPSVVEKTSSWHPGHCMLHAAGFWLEKASILHSCLQSESKCIERLIRLSLEHNSTAYLSLSRE